MRVNCGPTLAAEDAEARSTGVDISSGGGYTFPIYRRCAWGPTARRSGSNSGANLCHCKSTHIWSLATFSHIVNDGLVTYSTITMQVSGVLLSLFLNNAGGAWDNAKVWTWKSNRTKGSK